MDERVLELVIRWEELRSEGTILTVEELCPEDPSLWPALRDRLARRMRINPFLQARPTAAMPALPSIADHELLEVLGQGGMGIVYKARQVKLDRLVALKMIHPGALPTDLLRFRTEAEAVARLSHPNIAQIYEVGQQQGRPFLVLEYLSGGSLSQHLDGTPIAARTAAALLLPL